MTEEEEVNLALVITTREMFGAEAASELAVKISLPADLADLMRAGLTFEEVDLLFEPEGLDEHRYVWTMPSAESTTPR